MCSIDSTDEFIKKKRLLLAQEKERLKMLNENIEKLTINKNEINSDDGDDDDKLPLNINKNNNSNDNCDNAVACYAKYENVKETENALKTESIPVVPDNKINPMDKKDSEEFLFRSRNENSKNKSIKDKENIEPQEIKKNFIKKSPPMKQNETKVKSNENDMDQWISDKFYSHFPSLNEEILNKKLLSNARQLEYQEYLKKIPTKPSKKYNRASRKSVNGEQEEVEPINKLETLHHTPDINDIKINDNDTNLQQTKNIINDIALNKSIPRSSPRYRLLEDLITPNILNSDIVEERNKQVAAKELNKKMEYQKELLKQIEDKRREIKRLKERERIEEEVLSKRLEDQLKTMELEEQLEMEKIKSEKIRLNNEQNHLLRMQLLTKLSNDNKLYNPYGERKTQSENGKDHLIDKTKLLDDRNIYKFFTNSARYNKNNLRKLSSSSSSEEIIDSDVSLTDNVPSSTSTVLKKPAIVNKKNNNCNYCTGQDEYCKKCNKYVIATIDKKLNICLICYKSLLHCNNCKMQTDVCANCLKYQYADNDNGNNNGKIMCKYCYNYIKVGGSDRKNREQPYSLNLDENSIFNPKNKINEKKYSINIQNGNIFVDQVNDNESSTNKRIEKLYENYDDLRRIRNSRKTTMQNYSYNSVNHFDRPPLNKPEIMIRKKPVKYAQHAAFDTIEQKWDIPAPQNTNPSEKKPRILTQLGAIRKQLQIEQLEIDENTTYPSNSYRKK